jgi:hypothetical protein
MEMGVDEGNFSHRRALFIEDCDRRSVRRNGSSMPKAKRTGVTLRVRRKVKYRFNL